MLCGCIVSDDALFSFDSASGILLPALGPDQKSKKFILF